MKNSIMDSFDIIYSYYIPIYHAIALSDGRGLRMYFLILILHINFIIEDNGSITIQSNVPLSHFQTPSYNYGGLKQKEVPSQPPGQKQVIQTPCCCESCLAYFNGMRDQSPNRK